MRPPACVRCKWGTGTTCERPSDTIAAKEVKSNLEKMMAERARQDSAWFTSNSEQKDVQQSNSSKKESNNTSSGHSHPSPVTSS